MNRVVIGILAHVDSGKTTLSEGMLYSAGEIRKIGRVDHGDAFLDSHEIERDKGITIFSKQAVMRFRDTEFTLLDTPGHVDFSTEMERTLSVLDYAILVISGTDGIQNHTETLWRLLARYNVPTFIFVNKMDLNADRNAVLDELHTRFSDGCIDFTQNYENEDFRESLAMCDESIMNTFLADGTVKNQDIRNAVVQRKIFPCYFGSALKMEGVSEFLEGLELYTRQIIYDDKFGAKVFKIAEDEQGTYIMNSKDLCLLDHLPDLIKSGVKSLKIEGRMKSVHYVATVVSVYRKAIDAYLRDPEHFSVLPEWQEELLKISHRPYTTGFFEHRPEADGQVYTTSSYEQTADFVGLVNDYDAASGRVTLEQRNNVKEGETLEILTPGGTVFPWTLSDMEDETGTPIAAAPHAQMIFTAVGDARMEPYSLVRRLKKA